MGKASVLGFGSLLGGQQVGNHAAQGTESCVIETQERNHQDGGKVMALADHDDDQVQEESSAGDFQNGDDDGFNGPVSVAFELGDVPAVFLPVHAVFGRADEGGLMAEDGFQNSLGVVDRHAHAQREKEGEVRQFLPPGFGTHHDLGAHVKDADGHAGHEEQGHIHKPHEDRFIFRNALRADGVHQEAEQCQEQVGIIAGEVGGGFYLGFKGSIGAPDVQQDFLADLNGTLGPPVLLGFEPVHVHGKFRRGNDVVQVDEAPALELDTVGKVHVFRQGVMGPAARVADYAFAPYARSAVEGKEAAGTVAGRLFHGKMAVQVHPLDAGEEIVFTVDVAPAGLNEAHVFIREEMDGFLQEIRFRNEVCVQNQQEFPLRCFGGRFQRACLEAGAVRAVDADGVKAAGL